LTVKGSAFAAVADKILMHSKNKIRIA